MVKLELMMVCVSFSLLSVFCASEVAPPAAIFIFGDSTVDVGTNNLLLPSEAKADFSPNGIDFPYSSPTGRFSNGLINSADQIVRLFPYQKSPPPLLYAASHMATCKREILQGINFASAGSGIFQDTGIKRWTEIMSLGNQIQQFAVVRGNITDIVGDNTTDTLLSKSLFIIRCFGLGRQIIGGVAYSHFPGCALCAGGRLIFFGSSGIRC